MSSGPVFSLNAHATWACRHSGACCTAGWTIPVEARLQERVGTDWLIPGPDGACPEYDRPSGLCRLQRDGGEATLPDSCHQFPRRALIDGRGTFVNLSHYCPTAAALLVGCETQLEIVRNPPGFPAARGYEGLDARGEWPPLLRTDVLFDADSYATWERFLVEAVSSSPDGVDETLTALAATGEQLRTWTPEKGTLFSWTSAILGDAPARRDVKAAERYRPYAGTNAFSAAADTVPSGLTRPALPPGFDEADSRFVAPVWQSHAALALRYLGARAFASWTAYQSRGIRTQIAELFMTASVLRVECVRASLARHEQLDRGTFTEAVRASDLLLVHLADREALMAWLGKVEFDASNVAR